MIHNWPKRNWKCLANCSTKMKKMIMKTATKMKLMKKFKNKKLVKLVVSSNIFSNTINKISPEKLMRTEFLDSCQLIIAATATSNSSVTFINVQ